MANISATITLTSKTLFPNPLSVTAKVTDQINGDFDLQTINVSPGQNPIIFGPTAEADLSNTVYLFVQSLSTNTSNVMISAQDQNGVEIILAMLHPSDFMWLPLAVYGSNVKISCNNLSATEDAKISIFWGQRS